MDSLDTAAAGFMDDLLDFSSDIGEEEEEEKKTNEPCRPFSLAPYANPDACNISVPEFVEEEELEWISNKDAFPMVETFVDIIPGGGSNPVMNHQSPISVLENSSSSISSNGSNNRSGGASSSLLSLPSCLKVPGRARTDRLRRRRRDMVGQRWVCWSKPGRQVVSKPTTPSSAAIGRKCQHCQTEKTPQWRAGPMGPKTLCNACGVRFKSGRLVPEYRPASSPTFCSVLHSNSHRKIVEMRRNKLGPEMALVKYDAPEAGQRGLC